MQYNNLVSRKAVHSAVVASIASAIVTRTLTVVDPLTVIRGHARRLHIRYMILIPTTLLPPEESETENGLLASGATH